jgi:subtilisin family serine protease
MKRISWTDHMALAAVLIALAMVPAAAGAKAPGRKYIVVMRPGAHRADKDRAKQKAIEEGAKVRREYSAAIVGFAATLSDDALADVRRDKDVEYVEPDRTVSIATTQAGATWGLDRIDQRALPLDQSYSYLPAGANVTAYIIDTGIRTTHEQFGGRAVGGFDSIDGLPAEDCNGHGTHVAGTVGGSTYGVAKAVKLVAVRVLGCDGSGSTSDVVAGIDYVTRTHQAGQPAVANMSLGGGRSTTLDTAVQNSIADGVTYVVAAGNSAESACNGSPSHLPQALSVGATTASDVRAAYSNYGSCVDLFAPGSGITSAWLTSDTATNTLNGTSFATAHASGVAALYLQAHPSASAATVASAVIDSATPNVVTNPGPGSPNRLLFAGLTPPPPPPAAPPPPPASCGSAYSGTLREGGTAVQPDGTYYQSTTNGLHKGCLTGPANANFDLYLYRWNGSTWVAVAGATRSVSTETVSYTGPAGYYHWRVVASRGSGSYTLQMTRPK